MIVFLKVYPLVTNVEKIKLKLMHSLIGVRKMILFLKSLSTCHKCGKDKVAINACINRGVGKNSCIFLEENWIYSLPFSSWPNRICEKMYFSISKKYANS